MKTKVGDIIKVFDLPSYSLNAEPVLPVETRIIEITDYPLIIVNIEGRRFELYEDDGYVQV
tara:strand:- start:338 stop:520 length:183 start_codon:yes stop_codon:yes gene_type:complete